MSNEHNIQQAVRKIVLPSGRTIEVIRYDAPQSPPRGLHICPACESQLVQAVDWVQSGEDMCEITLECPNCGWFEHGSFPREQVEALEDRLDDGLTVLISDLQRLTQANMAADVERFSSALCAGHILPEDF